MTSSTVKIETTASQDIGASPNNTCSSPLKHQRPVSRYQSSLQLIRTTSARFGGGGGGGSQGSSSSYYHHERQETGGGGLGTASYHGSPTNKDTPTAGTTGGSSTAGVGGALLNSGYASAHSPLLSPRSSGVSINNKGSIARDTTTPEAAGGGRSLSLLQHPLLSTSPAGAGGADIINNATATASALNYHKAVVQFQQRKRYAFLSLEEEQQPLQPQHSLQAQHPAPSSPSPVAAVVSTPVRQTEEEEAVLESNSAEAVEGPTSPDARQPHPAGGGSLPPSPTPVLPNPPPLQHNPSTSSNPAMNTTIMNNSSINNNNASSMVLLALEDTASSAALYASTVVSASFVFDAVGDEDRMATAAGRVVTESQDRDELELRVSDLLLRAQEFQEEKRIKKEAAAAAKRAAATSSAVVVLASSVASSPLLKGLTGSGNNNNNGSSSKALTGGGGGGTLTALSLLEGDVDGSSSAGAGGGVFDNISTVTTSTTAAAAAALQQRPPSGASAASSRLGTAGAQHQQQHHHDENNKSTAKATALLLPAAASTTDLTSGSSLPASSANQSITASPAHPPPQTGTSQHAPSSTLVLPTTNNTAAATSDSHHHAADISAPAAAAAATAVGGAGGGKPPKRRGSGTGFFSNFFNKNKNKENKEKQQHKETTAAAAIVSGTASHDGSAVTSGFATPAATTGGTGTEGGAVRRTHSPALSSSMRSSVAGGVTTNSTASPALQSLLARPPSSTTSGGHKNAAAAASVVTTASNPSATTTNNTNNNNSSSNSGSMSSQALVVSFRSKVLLLGEPGTGKTSFKACFTSSVLKTLPEPQPSVSSSSSQYFYKAENDSSKRLAVTVLDAGPLALGSGAGTAFYTEGMMYILTISLAGVKQRAAPKKLLLFGRPQAPSEPIIHANDRRTIRAYLQTIAATAPKDATFCLVGTHMDLLSDTSTPAVERIVDEFRSIALEEMERCAPTVMFRGCYAVSCASHTVVSDVRPHGPRYISDLWSCLCETMLKDAMSNRGGVILATPQTFGWTSDTITSAASALGESSANFISSINPRLGNLSNVLLAKFISDAVDTNLALDMTSALSPRQLQGTSSTSSSSYSAKMIEAAAPFTVAMQRKANAFPAMGPHHIRLAEHHIRLPQQQQSADDTTTASGAAVTVPPKLSLPLRSPTTSTHNGASGAGWLQSSSSYFEEPAQPTKYVFAGDIPADVLAKDPTDASFAAAATAAVANRNNNNNSATAASSHALYSSTGLLYFDGGSAGGNGSSPYSPLSLLQTDTERQQLDLLRAGVRADVFVRRCKSELNFVVAPVATVRRHLFGLGIASRAHYASVMEDLVRDGSVVVFDHQPHNRDDAVLFQPHLVSRAAYCVLRCAQLHSYPLSDRKKLLSMVDHEDIMAVDPSGRMAGTGLVSDLLLVALSKCLTTGVAGRKSAEECANLMEYLLAVGDFMAICRQQDEDYFNSTNGNGNNANITTNVTGSMASNSFAASSQQQLQQQGDGLGGETDSGAGSFAGIAARKRLRSIMNADTTTNTNSSRILKEDLNESSQTTSSSGAHTPQAFARSPTPSSPRGNPNNDASTAAANKPTSEKDSNKEKESSNITAKERTLSSLPGFITASLANTGNGGGGSGGQATSRSRRRDEKLAAVPCHFAGDGWRFVVPALVKKTVDTEGVQAVATLLHVIATCQHYNNYHHHIQQQQQQRMMKQQQQGASSSMFPSSAAAAASSIQLPAVLSGESLAMGGIDDTNNASPSILLSAMMALTAPSSSVSSSNAHHHHHHHLSASHSIGGGTLSRRSVIRCLLGSCERHLSVFPAPPFLFQALTCRLSPYLATPHCVSADGLWLSSDPLGARCLLLFDAASSATISSFGSSCSVPASPKHGSGNSSNSATSHGCISLYVLAGDTVAALAFMKKISSVIESYVRHVLKGAVIRPVVADTSLITMITGNNNNNNSSAGNTISTTVGAAASTSSPTAALLQRWESAFAHVILQNTADNNSYNNNNNSHRHLFSSGFGSPVATGTSPPAAAAVGNVVNHAEAFPSSPGRHFLPTNYSSPSSLSSSASQCAAHMLLLVDDLFTIAPSVRAKLQQLEEEQSYTSSSATFY